MQYLSGRPPSSLSHRLVQGAPAQHLHPLCGRAWLPALVHCSGCWAAHYSTFWTTLRRLPAESEARWVLHGAIAVIIAVMVSGWTELTLGHSQVLEMFLAVLPVGISQFMLSRSHLEKVNR